MTHQTEALTDKAGRTLTREDAEQMAVDTIIRQGDERPYLEEAVGFMTDAEVMEWCVYPDTGEFPR